MASTTVMSLKNSIISANNDLAARCDVAAILSSMVDAIDATELDYKYAVTQKQLLTEKYKFKKVLMYAKHLEKSKTSVESELAEFRSRAITLRDNLAHEVGQLLNQSRTNERLKEKLREAELKLAHFNAIEAEWLVAKRRIRELERISASCANNSGSGPRTDTGVSDETVAVTNMTSTSSVPASTSEPVRDIAVEAPVGPANIVATSATVIGCETTASSTLPVVTVAPPVTGMGMRQLALTDLMEDNFVLIISFLDMVDILGVMLTCRHLCARVYVMFDISFTTIVREEWQMEECKPTYNTATLSAPVQTASILPVSPKPINAGSYTIAQETVAKVSAPVAQAVASGKAPAPPASPAISAEPSLSSLATSLFNASRDLVVRPPILPGAGVTPPLGGAATVGMASAGSNPGVLTQDMVGELTKKLTPNELKAIISIKEREQKAAGALREAQRCIDKLQDDKEMMTAKLESTEQSRDFLAQKIAGAERALKNSFDEVKVLKTQLGNDEKIIAYLDQQQQEVSLTSAEWKRKYEAMRASFDLQRNVHDQMEAAWRAQMSKSTTQWETAEKDYKAQKKLLVKEVKTLRINLLGANAERDKYRSQIELLKNALG